MKKLGQCAICGQREAVTLDHVPPKSIFTKPRPKNLITVPACKHCNNGSSQLDEKFKVYLGLHVSGGGPAAQRVFQESLKTTQHNKQLYREILSKLEPTYLSTETGIIHSQGYRVLWDNNAHSKVMERIIRGLYYHHFNHILGSKVELSTFWFAGLSPEMVNVMSGFHTRIIGQGEFIYKFGKSKENPLHSIWLFQFYQAHWAGGCTVPLDETELVEI